MEAEILLKCSFVFDVVWVNDQDGIFLALFEILAFGLESGFADGDKDVVMVGETVDDFLHDLLLLQELFLGVAHVLSDHLAQVPVDDLYKITGLFRRPRR